MLVLSRKLSAANLDRVGYRDHGGQDRGQSRAAGHRSTAGGFDPSGRVGSRVKPNEARTDAGGSRSPGRPEPVTNRRASIGRGPFLDRQRLATASFFASLPSPPPENARRRPFANREASRLRPIFGLRLFDFGFGIVEDQSDVVSAAFLSP